MSKAFKQGSVQSEQRLQATQIDQTSLSERLLTSWFRYLKRPSHKRRVT